MRSILGRPIIRRAMERQVRAGEEMRDALVYDVLPLQRVCRVKIQGSNEFIIAHYPENWEQTPAWLKPWNSVRIVHRQGVRGHIEVVGHGQTVPTGVTYPAVPTDVDAVLTGLRLLQCERPRMAVLVTTGTYRISGTVYTADGILVGGASSPYLLDDGGAIDATAGAVEISSPPADGYVRIDLVSIGTDGVIDYTVGTPATSDPVEPTLAAAHVKIGTVLVTSGVAEIYQSDINKIWYSDIVIPPGPGSGPGPDISGLNEDLMMNLPWLGSSLGCYGFTSQSPAIGQECLYFFEIPAGHKPTQLYFEVQTQSPGGVGDFESWVTDPNGNIWAGFYPHTPQDRVGFRDGTDRPVLEGYYLYKIKMWAGSYFLCQARFKPEELGPYPWDFTIKLCTDEADANTKMSNGTWTALWSNGYPYVY